MVSFDILCSNPLNLENKITKIEHKKFWGPIENFEKYFMAYQYMPKLFHYPNKNPPPHPPPHPPSYILNVRSLSSQYYLKDFITSCFSIAFPHRVYWFFRKTNAQIFSLVTVLSVRKVVQNKSGRFFKN